MAIYKHKTSADTLVVGPYSVSDCSSTELLRSFSYVESVLAVTALSHKEFTVCFYSLSPIIFSLEMGIVYDKSQCMVLPYTLLKQ